MSKRIVATLSASSMQAAMQQLQDYKKNLQHKCELFCQRLANHGILVAQENLGEFGTYITFRVDTELRPTGCKGVLVASNTGHIVSRWLVKDPDNKDQEIVKEADVSPLMMVEFGSGLRANNVRASEFNMGTGTFPEQTHAKNPGGWWYKDADDEEWHHSYGISPTMPMWRAAMEMEDLVVSTAREVFGS